ncbi:FmdB family zinc ribbon protein [Candidatus Poriferisodalis sp.]|uniref:FmdB family zinc ribbon protein n=1 Tax=Candidatus Poriferisodalis sp. TaxID=3101277 RepID=UPI003B029A5B
MPIYEYRCTDCRQTFERYQSFGDDPITVCPLPVDDTALNGSAPECGGEVRKVFSNVGISFKGSGFYRNDSRTESRPKSKTSGDGSSGSSSTSSSSNDSGTKDSTPSGGKESSSVGAASASG